MANHKSVNIEERRARQRALNKQTGSARGLVSCVVASDSLLVARRGADRR